MISSSPSTHGFTLIETMVAIAVLALALVGPFIAVENALKSSYVARDQLIAASLAQEGMEYIRGIRDNNYLASPQRTWLDGFSATTRDGCFGATPAGVCVVDPTLGDFHDPSAAAAMVEVAPSATPPPLYLSSTNLYNQQSAGTATPFTRTVTVQTIGGGTVHEAKVTVIVSWRTRGTQYSVTVTDTLQDWL